MGAVDPAASGIASGVVNSSRQVGGALGIAVLGSVAATLATNAWSDDAVVRASGQQSSGLTDLVVGGQGQVIAAQTGRPSRPGGA